MHYEPQDRLDELLAIAKIISTKGEQSIRHLGDFRNTATED